MMEITGSSKIIDYTRCGELGSLKLWEFDLSLEQFFVIFSIGKIFDVQLIGSAIVHFYIYFKRALLGLCWCIEMDGLIIIQRVNGHGLIEGKGIRPAQAIIGYQKLKVDGKLDAVYIFSIDERYIVHLNRRVEAGNGLGLDFFVATHP